MFFTLITYLLPVLQILFPLYFIYRLWTRQYSLKILWMIDLSVTIGFLAVMYFIGRWDITGSFLRYGLYGILFLLSVLSIVRITEVPFFTKKHFRWGAIPDLVVLIAMLLWILWGMQPQPKALSFDYPLKGSAYFIAHGGSTPPLNYHGAFSEPQTYALDITQLNNWQYRAEGIYPSTLNDYAIFGDSVYSPTQGVVINTRDSLNDLQPPETDSPHPTGNHIWIKSDSVYTILAHLKHHSIQVEKGEKIAAGEAVAQVGNTGNTAEPHLHIHAVSYHSPVQTVETLLLKGKPVPIEFNDQFLIRNNTFSTDK